MSERERWIVYPLLFLTMGLAVRDKLGTATDVFGMAKEVHAQRIVCEKLVLLNDESKPQVVLESTKAGGVVRAINADQTMQLALGHENPASSLFCETANANGIASQALLGDLRSGQPQHLLQWFGKWPLPIPFNGVAPPPAAAAKPAK